MNAIDDHAMWYGMLGPVVVRHGRTSLDLGPRQRRLLLTRLLIEDGRPVSLTELCHSLWGDEQPTAAVSSIRAYISRLRSVLDPDRKSRSSVLISGAAGYTLAVPREARNATTFEAHVLRAHAAFAREQLPLARAEIDTALGLWRGPALGEAAEEPFALREGARLNAARQDAGELLAAILIAQGDLVPAVSVAEQLTVGAPLREVSWSLLMRALYAAGRPVEALRQYDRFRTTLARELGLDPSPGLRDLHMAVLRHDTAALGIPRSPRTPTTLAGIPPVARTPLVGRSQETARLQTLLGEATAGQSRWAVVSGEPGSGKTRLLDEFAAQAGKAGFAVTRASGGHTLGRGRTVALRCAVTRLADGLRGSGEDGGAQDGPGEDVLTTLVRQIARVPTLCVVDDLDWATPDVHHQVCRLAVDAFETAVSQARAAGLRPEVLHLANSAAALAAPATHYDLVRAGLGLYGWTRHSDRLVPGTRRCWWRRRYTVGRSTSRYSSIRTAAWRPDRPWRSRSTTNGRSSTTRPSTWTRRPVTPSRHSSTTTSRSNFSAWPWTPSKL